MFFEFVFNIINAPIKPFLQLTLNLLSEPINLNLFFSMWVIVIYVLSMFYALLLIASGFTFITSGHNAAKRESAKGWLRNVVIMIVLVQASFFIYKLAIDLSSILTSATLTLVQDKFFLIGMDGITDLGLSILFGLLYLLTLLATALILVLRYAFVAIGVTLLPIAIFFYFLPPMKQYGALLLNFLGIAIFVTFFDALLLAGFSRLADVSIFGSMKLIVLITAFLCIDLVMCFLLFFGIVKSAFSVYSDVKKLGVRL
jgi:hypothetical protein